MCGWAVCECLKLRSEGMGEATEHAAGSQTEVVLQRRAERIISGDLAPL